MSCLIPSRAAEPDDAPIRGLIGAIIAADNRGDLETVLSLYSDDAILLPPGEEPVHGKAAIEERYRGIFSSTDLALESRVDSIRVATGWAVARGTITGSATSRSVGTPRRVDDKFLMVLEKSPAGSWLITELMWSGNSRPD